ncbi:TetR/AcrR family transcriptional regulator [Chitinivorax sp. B]|uniref:TetR/AcrR family transcriptional regulator n=1 Tax=Chitinivorax sp. B TaxID=2502235 RepID=UPI0010F45034|nr:TetR/AcrR family transcriptional regulator [Chitinivorax sp. B]
MGRNKTIDRDKVLDAAEVLITKSGTAGLTLDGVAKAVGISKGGVQYCFGSKDALIDALFERWSKAYEMLFSEVAGADATPVGKVRAHVVATQRSDDHASTKAASLMAALIQTPEYLDSTRDWYQSRIDGLDLANQAGRRARLAFLATEGAFMLRFFGLMKMDDHEWDDIFKDIHELLTDKS